MNSRNVLWIQLTVILGTTLSAFGQGTVMFDNRVLPNPPERRVLDVHGNPVVGTPLDQPASFVAQLYYGGSPASLIATTTTPARFVPPNAPTNFYGMWLGGTRTLTGFPPGQTVYMQVRVWDASRVSSYAEATEDTTGGQYGRSDVFTYEVPRPGTPASDYYLRNFRSFMLVTNPPNRTLVIRANGERVDLMMRGTHTIEGADNVTGPWNILYNGDAPFTDQDSFGRAARFYRINDADVYSVNAVGFYRIEPCVGFSMIANQLLAPGGNAVSNVIKSPANLAWVYKFNPATGGYEATEYVSGWGWTRDDLSLNPGEGAFLYTPSAWTNRFLGEIQLASSVAIPLGFSILSSPIPQTASFTDNPPNGLGFPVRTGDQVYQFRGCGQPGYIANEYIEGVGWAGSGDGAPPVIHIGESFFFFRNPAAGPGVWNRSFKVGP